MMTRRQCLLGLGALGALGAGFSVPVLAQADFPSRPVRMLVPFSAGGSPDLLARLIAQQLGKQLGQSVVVENRLGANGIIAAGAVANAAPDGYTLLVTTGSQAINPSIYNSLPYDTVKDFAPISLFTVAPALTLVINADSPLTTFEEFLAKAREPNGDISFGSPGVGNTLHLAGELLNATAGTHMLHVPYKGAAPALNAVMGGEVTACFLSTAAATLAVQGGRVRPIAVTSAERIEAFPDVPAMAEKGVENMDYNGGWVGVFAPGGTPQPIVQRLSEEIRQALQEPEIQQTMLSWESPPVGSSPEEFAAFFDAEMKKFAAIVELAEVPRQ